MSSKYPEVKTIAVRVFTDKPVRKTPYQVKGVLMNQFPEEEIVPMLDGSYRQQFLYPRVQVKILNEQIYIIGIGEGVDPIKSIAKKMDFMDFGNITFQVLDNEVEEHDDRFQPVSKLIRYRFVTPWVALNQTTGYRYRFLNNVDRVNFLNRLLGQNIVFMAREMGMELDENIFTKVTLSSLFPRPVDENNWGAFDGEFRANFVLPNYLGIGNGITRGYGTLFGLFNPEMFSFNEGDLQDLEAQAVKDDFDEESKIAESDLQEIDVNKVPRPKKIPGKDLMPTKRSKKVLSEEFHIEEDDAVYETHVVKPNSEPENKSELSKPKKKRGRKPKKDTSEVNYNSEKYHKKQHSL
ncbi:MAG: CRISPR-associated endonuclease Cas6 [Candidatus Marinimicrobia bacterium]|nr:CRISPR-associated endonuclease Cas6 [Candidatus Neomarinimicrobiota bacterium]